MVWGDTWTTVHMSRSEENVVESPLCVDFWELNLDSTELSHQLPIRTFIHTFLSVAFEKMLHRGS